jgi:Zn-dependent protease with chaperone function
MILSYRTPRAVTAMKGAATALVLAFTFTAGPARAVAPPSPATAAAVSAASADKSLTQGQASPPATPGMFRSLVPAEWLEAQGAQAYDSLLTTAAQQRRLLPADNAQVRKARAILQKLVPYALKWNDRAKDWKWELNIVRSPEINAICLPGGKIVLYTGMLQTLKLNDDETALLIAHLAAHALREHARTRIGQLQVAQLGDHAPQLFGVKGMEAVTPNVGPALIAMRYGADDETEADVIGADIASRAGYDPRAGLALWEKLERLARRRHLEFTLAHPISIKRLQDLKKRQRDMLPLYAKAEGTSVNRLRPYREGR